MWKPKRCWKRRIQEKTKWEWFSFQTRKNSSLIFLLIQQYLRREKRKLSVFILSCSLLFSLYFCLSLSSFVRLFICLFVLLLLVHSFTYFLCTILLYFCSSDCFFWVFIMCLLLNLFVALKHFLSVRLFSNLLCLSIYFCPIFQPPYEKKDIKG